MTTLVTDAFAQSGKLLDAGQNVQEVFDHILRALCRGLSRASPATVMQALQNLVVPHRTPFSVYQGELRLLVSNVRCSGQVAPDDGTMQLAIKMSIDDQSASLNAQIFLGRNMRTVPFSDVDELLAALDDLSLNQAVASHSTRIRGGDSQMVMRSRTYPKTYGSQKLGEVTAVDQSKADLEDEAEFRKVYTIMQKQGGFGKNNDEPPFYIHYADRESKDAARRAFGPRCLNCGDNTHFARNCPAAYINRSNIIHPAVGEGTPAEVTTRWRRWQQRLCQWHENRRTRRNN